MNIDDSRRAEWVRAAVDRFSGPLTRYAQVITGDIEQARDVVQDTFIRLCDEKPGRVDPYLAQWLFTVCRNRALDVQRKQSRRDYALHKGKQRNLNKWENRWKITFSAWRLSLGWTA